MQKSYRNVGCCEKMKTDQLLAGVVKRRKEPREYRERKKGFNKSNQTQRTRYN